MASYKITKGSVGPWTEGTVITDADLAANPGMGGVARLRDKLRVIEDTIDEPGDGDRSPENTTGSPGKANRKAADAFAARAPAGGAPGPNAGHLAGTPGTPGAPIAGKS